MMDKIKQFIKASKGRLTGRLRKPNKEDMTRAKEWAGSTRGLITMIGLFVAFFLIVIVVQSCTPKKGNILYGVCSQFLQQNIPFPRTIQPNAIEQYRAGVRIYYSHIDAFGEYMLEYVECAFEQDPTNGLQLKTAFFDTVKKSTKKERVIGKGKLYEVRPEVIDLFNQSQSTAIMLNGENIDLDLTIPEGANLYRY